MVMDMGTRTYQGLCLNGKQVLPGMIGQPFANYDAQFKNSHLHSVGFAAVFEMWVSSSNGDQSRARLGNNGEFVFVDDVSLSAASHGFNPCTGSAAPTESIEPAYGIQVTSNLTSTATVFKIEHP